VKHSIRFIVASVALLAPVVAMTIPASASTATFCAALKAPPTPPANDLSPSPSNVNYYRAFTNWAIRVERAAPSASLHTDYARIASAATSAAHYLLLASQQTGFSGDIKKAYDLTRAGADVVIINGQLAVTARTTRATCK
jgi:hypothetical protein